MYGRGLGVAQDDMEAMRWYRRAAAEGHPAAPNNIGLMYASGRAASRLDNASSVNPEEAIKWYRKAATKGYGPAEFNLGPGYLHGAGTGQDLSEALRWLRKAAEHGFAAAENEIGYAYEHGRGVPQDSKAAGRWYRVAADHGSLEARQNLGALSAKLGQVADNGAELSSADPSLPRDAPNSSAPACISCE